MNNIYGKYSEQNAIWKPSPKDPHALYINSVTRRNRELSERTSLTTQTTPPDNSVPPSSAPTSNRLDSIATSAEWSPTS